MMFAIDIHSVRYTVDIDHPIDISIPLEFGGRGPNAFHLPRPATVVAEGGDFIGDTRRGGSCNCETVTLNPHGNGTHTECVGHISNERLSIRNLLVASFVPSLLISVPLCNTANGFVISREDLQKSIDKHGELGEQFLTALIIRTLPNNPSKKNTDYSGSNPPYPSTEAMMAIRELGVKHLLLDVPSADREDDNHMTNHRLFWSMRNGAVPGEALERTITEMVYVEDDVADGPWMLSIQIPPFMLDAAPSRPLLHRVSTTTGRE